VTAVRDTSTSSSKCSSMLKNAFSPNGWSVDIFGEWSVYGNYWYVIVTPDGFRLSLVVCFFCFVCKMYRLVEYVFISRSFIITSLINPLILAQPLSLTIREARKTLPSPADISIPIESLLRYSTNQGNQDIGTDSYIAVPHEEQQLQL
jgi:hypothetical protein